MIAAGARVIHVDVMDGHFVPPITIGAAGRRGPADRSTPRRGLDVHLMIERPERYVAEIAQAGADNDHDPRRGDPAHPLRAPAIREEGCTAGAAINPATPIEAA